MWSDSPARLHQWSDRIVCPASLNSLIKSDQTTTLARLNVPTYCLIVVMRRRRRRAAIKEKNLWLWKIGVTSQTAIWKQASIGSPARETSGCGTSQASSEPPTPATSHSTWNAGEAGSSLKDRGLILNTFDDLEHDVLRAMKHLFPELYSLGPLSLSLSISSAAAGNRWSGTSLSLNLRKQDSGCMKWLNEQERASVVYVNFGSLAVVSAEQFVEFAWGLAESKMPFLWIVREDLVEGEEARLPEGFVEETKGRGFTASRGASPQFSRWLLDALRVELNVREHLCWRANDLLAGFRRAAHELPDLCREWGMGMEGEVKREKVASVVKELVGGERGEELRRNAEKWKKRAEMAAMEEGGSSFDNLERLRG
ncbi:UDP-glycosyltransferase 85A1 [Apostasia shenzhenica]|uniref:UDP-glycosyltransferase 85A1 n=1 Tax=Apostasia shenzhenica TaxID=1088818 RepID=A0A2I0AMQ7_9ASPA|nr:UDP-glycosyltransferase 85A1 [Apostasia shenzhenica]